VSALYNSGRFRTFGGLSTSPPEWRFGGFRRCRKGAQLGTICREVPEREGVATALLPLDAVPRDVRRVVVSPIRRNNSRLGCGEV